MDHNKLFSCLIFTATVSAFSSVATAEIVSHAFTGNDCAGYFGTGFDSCSIFVSDNGQNVTLSPVISKFQSNLSISDVNSTVFPSVDGSEFAFSDLSVGNQTGSWSYTPATEDPSIVYWVAKAGNGFSLFWEVSNEAVATGGACAGADTYTLACLGAAQATNSGGWITAAGKDLSHITFYGSTTPMVIPLPAALWLFAASVIGLAGFSRSR